MKKTRKKFLGFLGLCLVIAMTFIAAIIPGPSVSSITDTIDIKVINNVPDVKFTEPTTDFDTANPVQDFAVTYTDLSKVRIEISYTNKDGEVEKQNYIILSDLDYDAGDYGTSINLDDLYGYGIYVLSAYGTDIDGVELNYDNVSINYIPLIATAEQDENDGLVDLNITSYVDEVDTVDIYIDDEYIKTVNKSELDDVIKLDMGDRLSGEYTLTLIAKNADGEELYLPYDIVFEYERVNVPDTGSLFKSLNISKEDFVITVAIAFCAISAIVFILVAKRKRVK